ncbi:protein phosphatase 2C domain-containing protein [Candidatus Cyanaurora vandensis]|uniref:protein phosphatase 2C domain-containing protein n=1 Tax=Candidatus Cyanaurora vandensis TaxID=2714958 RepID=UPI0025808666|nr:protein phosphatase 2C domain-containing protein [Candidatus Cyanaurora vandensis]
MQTERLESEANLEEDVYPVTPAPFVLTRQVGETISVESYQGMIMEVLPRSLYQRYRVQLMTGETVQLWTGERARLNAQVDFLGQLPHRMLPQRLAWQEVDGELSLLLSVVEGFSLQQQLEQVGWVDLLGDYLQLVQLLKKIHQTGWQVLAFHPTEVVVGRPVVLEGLSYLTPLGTVPLVAVYLPGYTAPELAAGGVVTGQEDIYTLGALFYRLLTGEEPPEGGVDFLNVPAALQIPGAVQVLGRTLASPDQRCDFDELLRLVRQLRAGRQRQAFTYQVGAATTQGLNIRRTLNQDSWGYRVSSAVTDEGASGILVACVADGIGGMLQGEVASALATGQFVGAADPPAFETVAEQQAWTVDRLIRANQVVHQQLGGAGGCTLTGIVLCGARLTLAHLGDSRAYRVGTEGLVLLSEDHSLVRSLINRGLITETEALTHPQRNQLLRSVGEVRNLAADALDTLPDLVLTPEEVIFLCTDGVWECLDLTSIHALIWQNPDLQGCANAIIQRVLTLGAPDNATIVLVRCTTTPIA